MDLPIIGVDSFEASSRVEDSVPEAENSMAFG